MIHLECDLQAADASYLLAKPQGPTIAISTDCIACLGRITLKRNLIHPLWKAWIVQSAKAPPCVVRV